VEDVRREGEAEGEGEGRSSAAARQPGGAWTGRAATGESDGHQGRKVQRAPPG
jgi:hypothetical protein